jgi:hypothetical protein
MKLRPLLKKKRSKKAQQGIDIAIISFIIMTIGILIIAPSVLNVVRTGTGKFSQAINNTSPEASDTVGYVADRFVSLWDWVLAIAFLLNIILMFIAALFPSPHPIFVIFYIVTVFFAILFVPNVLDALDKIYDQFPEETGQYLPIMNFLHNHYVGVLLSIIVLSGILMYAKFKVIS